MKYILVTGEAKTKFVYVDVLKDKPNLGDTYIDSFGNILTVVEFQVFSDHGEFVKALLAWRRSAKQMNIKRDPNFKPRSKDKRSV